MIEPCPVCGYPCHYWRLYVTTTTPEERAAAVVRRAALAAKWGSR